MLAPEPREGVEDHGAESAEGFLDMLSPRHTLWSAGPTAWVYRGQADPTWELKAKGIRENGATGVRRSIPLAAPLADVLASHRIAMSRREDLGAHGEFVFVSAAGTLFVGPSLRKPLLRALAAAGVQRRFSVHGFRHTFNNLARQHADGEVVRSMTGHVTEKMTNHYSHVDHDEKRAVVVSILAPAPAGRTRTGRRPLEGQKRKRLTRVSRSQP